MSSPDFHEYEAIKESDAQHGGNSKTSYDKEDLRNRRRKKVLGLVVSAVALLLSTGLFISALLEVRFTEKELERGFISASIIESSEPTPRAEAFACIPCMKLLLDPMVEVADDPLLQKLTIEFKEDRMDCCAYNSEQIGALFESVARLNDLPDIQLPTYNASDFQFSPVSAHKRLYPERIIRTFGIPEIPEEPPVCYFKPDDPLLGTEHHRGVEILEKGLKVEFGGLYYIYASILFRPQSVRPCREFKYQTFAAYIERMSGYRPYSSEILLRTSHTCCALCINTQEVRFIGGVFILNPGDVIKVKVSGYELVHFHPMTTFAGLAMLGTPSESEPKQLGNKE